MIAEQVRAKLLSLAAARTRRPEFTGERRMLIVQPDHLGDVILSEPAVRLLRQRMPEWELVAVVGPWSREIVELAWPVDRIETVEFPGFNRSSSTHNPAEPYRYLRHAATDLRSFRADAAVVLREDAWWAAWLARAATGGHVVAGDDTRTRHFATHAIPTPADQHRTATAVDIATGLLQDLNLPYADNGWDMSPRLASGPVPIETAQGPSVVVLHPGSGAAAKEWPVHRWHAVIHRLADTRVLITGSGQEQTLSDELAAPYHHATSIAGETSLTELATVLCNASVAVGTDNGPMHLAGALGTPTVRLFGPSNPARYGPWPGTPGQAVFHAGWSCSRCEDLSAARSPGCGCMLAITPDEVVAKIRESLDGGA